jgi:peptide/nickel transport system substrate-binding protein
MSWPLRRQPTGPVHAAALATLCAVAVASCGSTRHAAPLKAAAPQIQSPKTERLSGGRRGGTLTALDPSGIHSVDPGRALSPAEFEIAYATQRPLFSYRPNTFAQSSPDLASEPALISPDARTVTVHIRHGVHFSPPVNREVTSADVEYAIERAANPNVATPYWAQYFSSLVGFGQAKGGPIRGVTTPDRYTIVFHLTEPRGQRVRDALALPISAPVPVALAKKYDAGDPSAYGDYQVATGPYMLRSNRVGKVRGVGYEPGRSVDLVRNPNWEARSDYRPAYLDEIVVKMGGQPLARGEQVLSGSGLVEGIPTSPATAQLAYQRHPAQLQISPGAGLRYIALETRRGPLSSLDVRKALWAALDRTALNGPAVKPELQQVASHFLYPEIPGFSIAASYLAARGSELDYDQHPGGDLRVAERYMRLAGYPSGRYSGTGLLRIARSADEPGARLAKSVDRTLKALGFRTALVPVAHTEGGERCGIPPMQVDICPGISDITSLGDGEFVLRTPSLTGDVLSDGNRPAGDAVAAALAHAIERESLLVGLVPRQHGWGAVDNGLVGAAVASPYAWLSEAAVESGDVAGVGDVWNRGAWDYSFTSLK